MHRHLVIFLLYNFRDFFQDYETDEFSWGAEALETSQSRKRRYSGEKKKRKKLLRRKTWNEMKTPPCEKREKNQWRLDTQETSYFNKKWFWLHYFCNYLSLLIILPYPTKADTVAICVRAVIAAKIPPRSKNP